ncbi:uncharacterized protein [Nicotiana tomentosiformis]|uniref:uncharacterized protein n=1 Tax=Nicotiana tomentosiformis TaxID=4098 RepID=UPI00388C7E3C
MDVFVPSEPGRPLFLYLTVLENSFGCVLGKHDVTEKREQAIYYLSKKFTSYEAKYTLLERTCCALTWVAQKLRHYLLAYTTYLITRMDPLKYIFQKPKPTGRLAKWQTLLTEFDIVYVTRNAMKAHALADHLAENPVDDEYQPLSSYFPDEEVNSVEIIPEHTNAWKIFFDGAVNAKGVGIGAILILPTGQHYPATARLRFFCTNNTAEYEACIMGMDMAVDLDVEELLIMGVSDLIIRQAQGEWETRDIKIIPNMQHVENLSKRFKSIEFRYIPRFYNELADALATLAAMLPYLGNVHIDLLEIQIRERHGYCNAVKVEPDIQPWYHDIKRFLKRKEYPKQANGDQKRTIRRLASSFFSSGEVLYKRTPNLNLLRCVDAKEAEKIMNEVHSGVCGPHINGYVLAKKILRAGYYWITMEKDCFSFVRKCHQCQIHGDLIHAPPSELHPMSALWPFVAWDMDVIGPIDLKASNGHRFILVAIDYFTKWVEAVTFKAVTKKAVVNFIHSNIICRFGIPKTIITDNAANLNSHLMRVVCEQFKITHRNSTPYRPKANGAIEAFFPLLHFSYQEQHINGGKFIKRGTRTVSEYAIRFSELARHVPISVPTVRERVHRFIEGLGYDLKICMARELQSDTLFQQVVQIARMLERVRNEERESKEAKSSRSSGGFSEFYSASSTDHGGGLGSRST